jgi:putative methyltransferase
MSLYYEAQDLLTAPTNAGGNLKSRIFSKKDLKSQPAQIYALAIETSKWSSVLKEVVENADILRIERKVSATRGVIGEPADLICLLANTCSFNPPSS